MRILFFTIFCFFSLQIHAESDYILGEGLKIGSLPVYVGGYISFDYRNKDSEDRYRADDLALLGYGNYKKFSYMLELEFKSFYVETHANDTVRINKDTKLYTERAYIDYALSENYLLRFGKYNSPVGYWNLLPINVLRDTSSNPLTTSLIFPKYTTGIDINYSSFTNSEMGIDVMLQENSSLDDDYNNYEINRHYGLGLNYATGALGLKVNAGYFRKNHAINNQSNFYYGLLSAKYEYEKYQFMGEIGTQSSSHSVTTDYAAYVQGVYHFTEKHSGIIRLESYHESLSHKSDYLSVLGYTYRPIYPIAIKTEYQLHSVKSNNQFIFSVSVLF